MEPTNNLGDIVNLNFPKRALIYLVRTFFQLLYHQLAWTYDTVAWIVSLGSWQKWIQSTVQYLNGPKILEIGFGPGHLQVSLQQKKVWVVGIDESRQMAMLTQNKLARRGFLGTLVRGDAERLPFTSESFDQVVMTFPSEFILNLTAISEFMRVLVKGGSAVLLPMAWITGRKPLERFVAWVNQITGEAPKWDPSILEPLMQAGFDVRWNLIDYSRSRIVVIQMRKR